MLKEANLEVKRPRAHRDDPDRRPPAAAVSIPPRIVRLWVGRPEEPNGPEYPAVMTGEYDLGAGTCLCWPDCVSDHVEASVRDFLRVSEVEESEFDPDDIGIDEAMDREIARGLNSHIPLPVEGVFTAEPVECECCGRVWSLEFAREAA